MKNIKEHKSKNDRNTRKQTQGNTNQNNHVSGKKNEVIREVRRIRRIIKKCHNTKIHASYTKNTPRNNSESTQNNITPNANMKITSTKGKIKQNYTIPRHNPRIQEKYYRTKVGKFNHNIYLDKNKVNKKDIGIDNVQTNHKN